MNNYAIGIDIGSTATKVVVLKDGVICEKFILPTGWNCKNTAEAVANALLPFGISVKEKAVSVVATGYGRISVSYANEIFSEIKCHGIGAAHLFSCNNATIIDIGGQDTKVITIKNGNVADFLMNDKCSAGTGKFIEIMANRLGLELSEMTQLAEQGQPVKISSMCTVFAESEIISHIGEGVKREDIAAGIIQSVTEKAAQLAKRHGLTEPCFLTGGLCDSKSIIDSLSKHIGCNVTSNAEARYAGAIGAAVCASKL